VFNRSVGLNQQLMGAPSSKSSLECVGDVDRIAAVVPRLIWTFGGRGASTVSGSWFVELEPGIASELARAQSAFSPTRLPFAHPMFEMGFAIKARQLAMSLANWTERIVKNPFRCEALLPLNEAAQQLAGVINQKAIAGWPAYLQSFQGLFINVDSLSTGDNDDGSSTAGYAIIEADDLDQLAPLMATVIGTVPALKADGQPVKISSNAFNSNSKINAFLALSKTRLAAVAAPEGGTVDPEAIAADVLTAGSNAALPMISIAYDYDKIKTALPNMQDNEVLSNLGRVETTLRVDKSMLRFDFSMEIR
jgi:hypothetical protein